MPWPCLKDKDANTLFYHRQGTYRGQKKRIKSIATDNHVLVDHAEMHKLL
jgi:hypothetical protein